MKKKKLINVLLSITAIVLLIVSFPLRDVLRSTLASDICRIIGFLFLMTYFVLAIRNKNHVKSEDGTKKQYK